MLQYLLLLFTIYASFTDSYITILPIAIFGKNLVISRVFFSRIKLCNILSQDINLYL